MVIFLRFIDYDYDYVVFSLNNSFSTKIQENYIGFLDFL